MAVEKPRDLAEGLQILEDLLGDAGALDLDGDRPSVAQARPMHPSGLQPTGDCKGRAAADG